MRRNRIPGGGARLLPILLLSLPLLARPAGAETGTVLEVVDGDTLVVRVDGETATVRLIGIDAPERSHPSLGKEFLADVSTALLSSLCLGKVVRMEADAEDADHYDRRLRYVFLPRPDGRLLNLEMLRAGMARLYARFPFSRRDEFAAAEGAARRDWKGLWGEGGMAEARWLVAGHASPVNVYPSGGKSYSVSYAGLAKPGVERRDLAKEIEWLLRQRAELSDAEFSRKARERGYRPVEPSAEASGREPRAGSPPPADARGVVPWEEAHRHAGEEIVVEGTIVRAHRGEKVLYLNFHPNWKRYLSLVVPAEDLPRFPHDPEKVYMGKRVRVRGEVRIRKDRPEMVVRDPAAVAVLP
jgi:endonuclease YncB( thermonuclease family)